MLRALKAVRLLQRKPDPLKPLLVTIGASHFAEKARWCLDMSPLRDKYVEEMHTPAFHLSSTLLEIDKLPRVRSWGADARFIDSVKSRHPREKEKTGVPKLVLPSRFLVELTSSGANDVEILSSKSATIPRSSSTDPNTLTTPAVPPGSVVVQGGSAGIMRFLVDMFPMEMGHLYPTCDSAIGQQVLDLDEYFDAELGRAATAWCFGNILLKRENFYTPSDDVAMGFDTKGLNIGSINVMLKCIESQDVPFIEKFLFRNFGPKHLVPVMVKANNITANEKSKAKEKIREIFQLADKLLKSQCSARSGSPYSSPVSLLGTPQITAADITFASLAAPILMPPQMTNLMPGFDSLKGVLSVSERQMEGCVHLAEFARELRNNFISAQFCLKLYENHRFIKSSEMTDQSTDVSSVVEPKTAQYYAEKHSTFNRWMPKKYSDPTSCRPER